jgi:hypothetical protein
MIGFMLWLAVIIAVVLVWAFFRQGGYKRDALTAPPGPGWVKTDERFVDPTSGETLDVWFDPRTGERAYVRAGRSV